MRPALMEKSSLQLGNNNFFIYIIPPLAATGIKVPDIILANITVVTVFFIIFIIIDVNMEKLPPELVSAICKWLPQKDICSFRLSSKRYSLIAASHLTEQHLMFLPKSFRNILKISQQPHLREHVKSIFYEGGILQTVSYEDWRSSSGYSNNFTPAQLQDGYTKYKEALRDVDNILGGRSDYAMLAEVFRNLPNLKTINLVLGNKHTRCYSEAMKAAFGPTLVMPGILSYRLFNRKEFQSESGEFEFASLVSAVANAGTKLEGLRARKLSWVALDIFQQKELLPPVFLNLKYLSLEFHVSPLIWTGTGPSNHRQSILGEAMRLAEGLESLILNGACENLEPWKEDAVDFNALCDKMVWPRLEFLSLIGLETDEDFFFDFMFRHASSLRHLYLGTLWLTEGSWETTFRKIRTCLRLQQFGIFDEPFVNGNESIIGAGPEIVAMSGYLGYDRYQILGDKRPLNEQIEDWFMEGGADPFLDKAALEPTEFHLSKCDKLASADLECSCRGDESD